MPLPLARRIAAIHAELLPLRDGEVADYIPELTRVDHDAFAIAVVTADGHTYAVGDEATPFTIQSISKAFVYAAALADRPRSAVRERVGVEPSGEAFNSISLDPRTGAPRNPMINAGAIATTALVAGASPAEQWTRILGFLSACAGRQLDVDEAVYGSESATGFRNRAIAWMLRNFGKTADDPMPALENYFRQCSVRVTVRDLAVMAATLACGGFNPVSREQVMEEATVESVLSVMATCGMYDASGAWLYDVGMPAKSGVGGGIIAVLPGRLGIAVFSPRLDAQGNSVRGLAACRRLSRELGLHVFGRQPRPEQVLARVFSAAEAPSGRRRTPAQAVALREEAEGIRVLSAQGEVGLDGADYLVRQMAALRPGTTALVLDLHRITHLAPVAAALLLEAAAESAAEGRPVVLARVPDRSQIPATLAEAGGGRMPATFPDLESAIAWCESSLLQALNLGTERIAALDLGGFPLFAGLGQADLARIVARLVTRSLTPGEALMRQGDDAADGAHLLMAGELDVCTPRPDGGLQRLATLAPGQVAGELALAGQTVRTATVIARSAAEVSSLPVAAFAELLAEAPELHAVVLRRMCLELADKISVTNRLVASLHLTDAPAVGSLVESARTTTFWRRAQGRRGLISRDIQDALRRRR